MTEITTTKRWMMGDNDMPIEVEVVPSTKDYWFVLGTDKTMYKGHLYTSVNALLDAKIADAQRSLRYAEERLAKYHAMRTRIEQS